MKIFITKNSIFFYGKFNNIRYELKELSKKYTYVQELISSKLN